MNFDFTDEQKQFAEAVRRFAQAHLAQARSSAPTIRAFPSTWRQLMAKQGLMGISLPRARRRPGRHA